MNTSLEKSDVRIVLLENISSSARETFAAAGYTTVEEIPRALSGQELIEQLRGAHVLGIRSNTHLTVDVLAQLPDLITVGCFCIGTNQVDLHAALESGVPVFNAPFSNTRSVAELTLSSIIALTRRVPEKNAQMHRGVWDKSAKKSYEVRGKTLGIIGYGNIGAQLSVLAEHMGMHVVYFDIQKKLSVGNARQLGSLEEVLAQSDIVSVHVPDNPSTRGLISAAQFSAMKDGVSFINYSRGTVVDIDALVAALRSGHIAGAAIDVYPSEPKSHDEEFVSALREFDNVILTPHIGGSTEEAQRAIGYEVSEALVKYLDNGSTSGAVNFPQVSLPQYSGVHRFLNIHKNVPGMLKQINSVIAEVGGNVVGQFLQTNATTGYLVLDIEAGPDSEALRQKIQTIPGCIRTRALY